MKTLNTKQCLTLVGLLATGMMLSSVAVAAKGKGNNDASPYALSVTALQDVTGNTDVYLDVSVVENGFSAPGKAKHIQMKSFDLEDEVRWAKNLRNVALSDGSVQFAYGDMLRHQPVQAQIQVQNDETRNTEVLKTKSHVLLRPDLKVTAATDAYQALVGEVISVVINVEELNGDVGADSTVSIVDGMLPLDFADGVHVEPMTGSTVIFALSFDEPGEYDLSAIAGNVNPGDYDDSNNAANFMVTVTEPEAEMATVPYYMYYNRSWSNYHYEYQTYYGTHFYTNDYHWESLSNSLYWYEDRFQFPVDRLTIDIAPDNGDTVYSVSVENVQPSYSYSWGCYTHEQAYLQLGQGISANLYTSYDSCSGDVYSQSINLYTWSDSYTYYSYYHDSYYGNTSEYSYDYSYGEVDISATSSVSTYIVVEDGGASTGGRSSLSLGGYSYSYYDYYDYGDGGYYLYESAYGYYYGWGYGETTLD